MAWHTARRRSALASGPAVLNASALMLRPSMATTVSPLFCTAGADPMSTAVMTSSSLLPRAVTRAADSGMMRNTIWPQAGRLSWSQ